MHHQFALNQTLEEMLQAQYLSADLKQLAALICPNVPSWKDERVQAIVQTLFADLQGIFEQLDQLGQHAVSETVHIWNRTFEFRMFVNKYGSSPRNRTGYGYERKKDPAGGIQTAWQRWENTKIRGFCMPAGDKYLVAVPGKEQKFIKALESACFIIGVK